jgi:hypothetical protein
MDLKLKGSNTEKVREKNASGRRQNLIAKRTTHNTKGPHITQKKLLSPPQKIAVEPTEKKNVFLAATQLQPRRLLG